MDEDDLRQQPESSPGTEPQVLASEPAPTEPQEPASQEPQEPAPSQEDLDPEPQAPEPTGSPRLDKRIERFTMKLRNEYAKTRQPSQREPYQPANLEDMEYDPDTLETLKNDRQRYADDQVSRVMEQERFVQRQEQFMDRFEIDAERVMARYPELDEDSEKFDPTLTAEINESYLAFVGYDEKTGVFRNPIVRYKDYVDREMATIERIVAERSADTAGRVATQAARTGVRPSGAARASSLGPLNPGDITKMSDEEFEKHKAAIDAEIKRGLGI